MPINLWKAQQEQQNGESEERRRMMDVRRLKMGLLASLCVLLAALLGVPTVASAATTHNPEPFSPLDGSGSGLMLEEPNGVAIDEATGNVFVTDGGVGHERVAILGGEDGAPVGLASPYEISGFPFGINEGVGLAYDNSQKSAARGTLYVFDKETQDVEKFVRNATTKRYETDGTLTLPDAEIEVNSVSLSVDGSGDLYVSAPGGSFVAKAKIFKFSPAGTLLAEYTFPSSQESAEIEGAPTTPGPLVVDSAGDLFVSEGGLGVYKFPANGSGEIDPSVYTSFMSGFSTGVAIDPATDHVFAALEHSLVEYDTAGKEIDEFGSEQVGHTGEVAFDSESGRIYVADSSTSVGGHADVNVFGPAVIVPTTGIGAASNVTGVKATLNGSVDPEGIKVKECFFEWGMTTSYGHTAPCKELLPTDSETHPVSAEISGLVANGTTYHFRLVATNANGKERSADRSFETADTVATEAATGVGSAAATLNGTVRPEGLQYTNCVFEYGLTTSAGFEKDAGCAPSASELPADFLAHAVSATLTGLQPNSTYKFRLTATTASGTLSAETLTFTTQGPPQIGEIRALEASQSSATLEAKVDPSGFGTSYRFEWGPTSSYGNSVPADFEAYVGEGEKPVLVTAKLSGLSAGTAYHYRLVAQNQIGASESTDQVVETLDSCGLPNGRCFELVSPREIGPVARPGIGPGATELHYQAAPQPGLLAYFVETGFPEATKGTEVLYVGSRGAGGWNSSQFSNPVLAPNESISGLAFTGQTLGLSDSLECGVLESNQPLTSNADASLVREAGGANLYRRNPDRTYTAITSLPPENIGAVTGQSEYNLAGFSRDCGKVVFSTEYRYSHVGGAGRLRLYEWDDGTLSNVGFVPGPTGEVPVEAGAGSPGTDPNYTNVVSADGSRVFFSAKRQTSPDPEEIGKTGVFVRENGTSTRDVSLSETATPDEGATYQYATKDGSRVFFTANAGLTKESSDEGKDLYEYNLEDGKLTDLSTDREAGGAEVAGFVGASEDGTHVYFVARGQLVPARGNTFAQNEHAGTYSLYGEQNGTVGFVGTIGNFENELERVTLNRGPGASTSQVSPDGRYLLFQSSADVTGYEAGNKVSEAYLYDADSGSEATVCVSCRQDGRISVTPAGAYPLGKGESVNNPLHAREALTENNGVAQVYFTSYDSLASGAVAGRANVYEWSHGQVFTIATQPAGLSSPQEERNGEKSIQFAGASSDGTDLYFTTTQALNWENREERWSVYDARVGGGFPEPPPAPSPCNADGEGSCQGASSLSPASGGAASATFVGPGNLSAPPVSSVAPSKSKLTRALQLAKALRACRRYKAKARRGACEKSARSNYGATRKAKAKARSHKRVQSHKGGK